MAKQSGTPAAGRRQVARWVLAAVACFLLLPSLRAAEPVESLTVTAERIDLSVSGGLTPELRLDERTIRAFGTGSLEELIEELAPEIGSGRGGGDGRPAFLVNGRRIANFREIRSYPPEAVERIEIFPEEVALRHGFRPDRKVVNIVLKPRFSAVDVEVEAARPRSGAGETLELEVGRLGIRGVRRANVGLDVGIDRAVHEADREVQLEPRGAPASVQGNLRGVAGGALDPVLSALAGEPVTSAALPQRSAGAPLALVDLLPTANAPVVTDVRPFRTLRPESRALELDGSLRRPLGDRIALTVAGSIERAEREADLGLAGYTLEVPPANPFSPFTDSVRLDRLAPTAGRLERRDEELTAALDLTLTGSAGRWNFSWLGELERRGRRTRTDRRLDSAAVDSRDDPFGVSPLDLPLVTDVQRATTDRLATEFVAAGVLGTLPAGPASASGTLRIMDTTLSSRSEIDGGRRHDEIGRRRAALRASLDLPLFDDRRFGRLAANANGEYADLDDLGALHAVGAGLTWRPAPTLRLILSVANEQEAPTISELGDPRVAVPNQRLFDFRLDAATTATLIEGGNAALLAAERRVWRAGLRLEPFDAMDLVLNADLSGSHIDDPVIGFPTPSEEIEAAFPDRFHRDAAGALLALDARPLNVAGAQERELRWGLRFTRAFEVVPPPGRTTNGPPRRTPGDASGHRRGAGGRGLGSGPSAGRLSLSLRHTWRLEDRLELADGLPAVDYVGRSAGGRQRGGAAHVVDGRMTFTRRGIGFRGRLRWRDGTTSLPQADGRIALRTAAVTLIDLELFRTFRPREALVQRLSWLSQARVTVGVDNLLDDKPRVEDARGETPAGRTPDDLDPLGRVFYLEFRRLLR